MLAGALTGGSCSHFGVDRVANNMLSIIFDPAFFQSADGFSAGDPRLHHPRQELEDRDAGRRDPHARRARSAASRRKLREGIEIDDTTWSQIVATGESLGVSVESTAP